MASIPCSVGLILCLSCIATWCLTANAFRNLGDSGSPSTTNDDTGTKWALLVAGSKNYVNYRHQADVCHAYQILKRGGLKDENIIVFMYDDIANNSENPKPGVIINKPDGSDVYKGVPKDYTGDAANPANFYAAILGNKSALSGGSGKVLASGPNDHIFIYYAGHGGPGSIGMPSGGNVFAKDFIDVLNKKHAANGYKSMVIYMESAQSGSMFEGLLPDNVNIYATTSSTAAETSFATYCPGDVGVDPNFHTCLGDLFSVSWMEDCDDQDLGKETLAKQYDTVQRRTNRSDVTQYGDKSLANDFISTYMGESPSAMNNHTSSLTSRVLSQRDAKLLYFQYKFERAPDGSSEKLQAQKTLLDEIAYRSHEDHSINRIGEILFGNQKSSQVLKNVRPSGKPLLDDWDCFKMFVRTYEKFCGPFSTYGRKYMRAIANICNAGVTIEKMVAVSEQTCSKKSH